MTCDVEPRCRNDQQTRDMVGPQLLNIGGFLRRIVVRIAQNHAERALVCYVLDASNHAREKGVGDIRNHHAEDVGSIPPQTAGQRAGLISQTANGFEYTLPQFGPHDSSSVDDMGHRADRDFSPLGNLPHCYPCSHADTRPNCLPAHPGVTVSLLRSEILLPLSDPYSATSTRACRARLTYRLGGSTRWSPGLDSNCPPAGCRLACVHR